MTHDEMNIETRIICFGPPSRAEVPLPSETRRNKCKSALIVLDFCFRFAFSSDGNSLNSKPHLIFTYLQML